MITSEARVKTDRPSRYLKQLVSHFSNKLTTEQDEERGRIEFAYGTCVLAVEPDVLVLRAEAADEESLAKVEDVAARHLVRFGQRDELQVDWAR